MRTLAWIQRTFMQNCDEKSRNSSTGKPYSCFSALLKLDGQPKVCPDSSISLHGMKELNEEKTVEMSSEFFHGFLAIGTLGSISTISEEAFTPKDVTTHEIATAKNESKKVTEKEEYEVTEDKKINVEYSLNEYSKLSAIKEETKEQISTLGIDFVNDATSPASSYKKSRKLNGIKGATQAHVLPFMKKMMKKTFLTSCCSQYSVGVDANSTEKISSKAFKRSRKIHPEASNLQVPKSHNYEVNKVCYEDDYDRDLTLEEEDEETVSDSMFANMPVNSQTDVKKAHWIKSDPDYFVLEF